MEKLRYYTKGSGWGAFKSKSFWLLFLLGCAITITFYICKMDYWYASLGLVALAFLILLCRVIKLHSLKIFIYDTRIVIREGVFARSERNIAFMGVLYAKIDQSFLERIFRFGDVYIDLVGKYDINKTSNAKHDQALEGISNPRKLKKFLDTRMAREDEMSKVII